jgi:hypothetical protein
MTLYLVYAPRLCLTPYGTMGSHKAVGGFSRLDMALSCARRYAGNVWVQDENGAVYYHARDGREVTQ